MLRSPLVSSVIFTSVWSQIRATNGRILETSKGRKWSMITTKETSLAAQIEALNEALVHRMESERSLRAEFLTILSAITMQNGGSFVVPKEFFEAVQMDDKLMRIWR